MSEGIRERLVGCWRLAGYDVTAVDGGRADRPLGDNPLETGHTDTVDSTSLHVPDLGLIVSGDVAYNHCHMYVAATTPGSRAEWIAALDKLAALSPAAVVTGHKDPTQGNPPSVLAESRGYIEYYGQLREAGVADQDLFDAMVTRYPDWVSRQQFLILG